MRRGSDVYPNRIPPLPESYESDPLTAETRPCVKVPRLIDSGVPFPAQPIDNHMVTMRLPHDDHSVTTLKTEKGTMSSAFSDVNFTPFKIEFLHPTLKLSVDGSPLS